MKEIKIIKRYQNRKLYDTEQSSYVTLDMIAKMIRNGENIQVIDNQTHTDITRTTLIQLLYETERKVSMPTSVDLLKEIIGYGDGSFSGYIDKKLKEKTHVFDPTCPNLGNEATILEESISL